MIKLNSLMDMADPKKQVFQIYFAGASLAFGLPFLIVEVIGIFIGAEILNQFPETFGFLYVSLYVTGGLLGGALVARRVQIPEALRAGAITGLMAYIFNQVIYVLFFGIEIIGDPYTLFAMVGGSFLGAFLTRQSRIKKEEEEKEEQG